MRQVLLIHPPIAKPGEPPAGIARLKGSLNQQQIKCSLIDANLEGIHYLLQQKIKTDDTWSKSAFKNVDRDISTIKDYSAFKTIDNYNRIVKRLNRILTIAGREYDYLLTLGDCSHKNLSPLNSDDLIKSAHHPEKNPFYDYYQSVLIPKIEKESPEIIGLSINFLSQALCAFALIGLIRKTFPNVKLSVGGGLITSWIRNSDWKDPFSGLIDYAIDGPGESFFSSYFNIDCPLRSYPTPVYDDLSTLIYLSPGFVLPYATSSGCYFKKCRFCPEQAEGNPYKQLPSSQVIKDLQLLCQQTKPSLIHFLDSALSPALLKRFTSEPPPAPWYGYVRFTEDLTDLAFCLALKKSGCRLLKLGLESGEQNILDKMNKGINLKTATKILANFKKAGIPTFIYLLFGTPYESEATAQKTMDFVLKHHQEISYINPALFNMPISSDEAKSLPTHPFSKGNLSLYTDFDHPMGWNREKVRHFLDRVFKRHPVIAGILRQTPKIFTSNHAPFFN
ncbi:B12-binding domain-containing radical SAM protein [Candidatus Auribacterota bacterium]